MNFKCQKKGVFQCLLRLTSLLPLQIMIYLIEHVLPLDYFANDLQALSVDLSVFQELVQGFMPELSNHLDHLRKQSLEERGKYHWIQTNRR